MTEELAKKALLNYINTRVPITEEEGELIINRFHLKEIKKNIFS